MVAASVILPKVGLVDFRILWLQCGKNLLHNRGNNRTSLGTGLNHMDKGLQLPLYDTLYPSVHHRHVPRNTLHTKPVCLQLTVSLRQELHGPVIYNEYCSRIKGIDHVQTSLILVGRPHKMALPWRDGKCSRASEKQSFIFVLCGKRCFIDRSKYIIQGWMQTFTLVT